MSRILKEFHIYLHAHKNLLLHYHTVTWTLIPYCWCVHGQVFSYPGCLCAVINKITDQTESVSSHVSTSGGSSGKEYIASCAQGLCGYAGMRDDWCMLNQNWPPDLQSKISSTPTIRSSSFCIEVRVWALSVPSILIFLISAATGTRPTRTKKSGALPIADLGRYSLPSSYR